MSAEIDVDSLVFVAERALNTGDTQDHVFVDDSADGECFVARVCGLALRFRFIYWLC